MSTEIKAISTTVSADVSLLWQKPLFVNSNGWYITTYPPQAELHVTCGSVESLGILNAKDFGYVVTFSNSLTAQAKHLEIGPWWILYCFSVSGAEVAISFDSNTGNFVATHPCYAAIQIGVHDVPLGWYKYTPGYKTYEGSPWKGPVMSYGMAYVMLPAPTPLQPPQIATCNIPAPQFDPSDNGMFERYRVTMPTVLTPDGEWHKPVNFDSDSYDQANAYGPGQAGPSKDDGYVLKEHPLETGFVSGGGNVNFNQSGTPSIKGPDGYRPQLSMIIPNQPNVSNKVLQASASDVADRHASLVAQGYNINIVDQSGGTGSA